MAASVATRRRCCPCLSPRTTRQRGRSPGLIDYPAFLDLAALEGARIGVWRAASAAANAATEALLDGAVDCLPALGAAVVDPVDLPDIDKVTEPEFDALNYEFKHGIDAYLKYLADFVDGSDMDCRDAGRPDRVQRAERPLVLAGSARRSSSRAGDNGDLADRSTSSYAARRVSWRGQR